MLGLRQWRDQTIEAGLKLELEAEAQLVPADQFLPGGIPDGSKIYVEGFVPFGGPRYHQPTTETVAIARRDRALIAQELVGAVPVVWCLLTPQTEDMHSQFTPYSHLSRLAYPAEAADAVAAALSSVATKRDDLRSRLAAAAT